MGDFATNLKGLRQAQGLSQRALAAKAGLRQGQISNWEKGRFKSPRMVTLLKLADALSVGLKELVGDNLADLDAPEQASELYVITKGLAKDLRSDMRSRMRRFQKGEISPEQLKYHALAASIFALQLQLSLKPDDEEAMQQLADVARVFDTEYQAPSGEFLRDPLEASIAHIYRHLSPEKKARVFMEVLRISGLPRPPEGAS